MKYNLKTYLFLFCLISLQIRSQIILGNYPTLENKSTTIKTDTLLLNLNWNNIKEFSKINNGHYTHERNNGLINEFEYVKQGYTNYFLIKSFKGDLLSFESDGENQNLNETTNYFNKQIWKNYVNEILPELPTEFHIDLDNKKDILISYYKLLGVDSRDEYGWICEYSSAGLPPEKRIAIINLIKYGRIDLLKRLLDYSNIQTQIYAADALIYFDFYYTNKIQESKRKGDKIDNYSYFYEYLLDDLTRKKIRQLKDKNESVKICGNNGSYKIYKSFTNELLSDEKIKEIPQEYKFLKDLGYEME